MTDLNKSIKENGIVKTYVGILLFTFIFLFLINHFNISYPLTIAQRTASSELAVVGEGKVDVIPDTANVDLGIVVNDSSSVINAQNQINKVNNAIVDDLKQLGIDKKDIKTSNYSITPAYDYSKGGNGTITGYNGNATVTVKVRQTDKLTQVIEAATKAGANQVIGTNYSIDNPETYREQARNMAIANAKQQAQKLSDELGIKLGKITNIAEATNPVPVPMYEKAAPLGLGAGGTTAELQPGTQTVTSTVTLYFEKR